MRRWTAMIGVLALAACGGESLMAAGPARVGAGSFVLARVNTQPIPTTIAERFVTAGYLQLDSSGVYERQQRDSVKQLTGGFARIDAYDHGTWESRGDSIFLTTTVAAFGYGPGIGIFSATGVSVATQDFAQTSQTEHFEFTRIAWCGSVRIYHDITCRYP